MIILNYHMLFEYVHILAYTDTNGDKETNKVLQCVSASQMTCADVLVSALLPTELLTAVFLEPR